MRTVESDMPFPVVYLAVLAAQVPLWLGGGLMWAGLMVVSAGLHPLDALVAGLWWAFTIWLLCGNVLAAGLAWRRTAEFDAPDRSAFRAALGRACNRLRLKVLAELPDAIVLGPRRALIRFRLQEVRIAFAGDMATVTGPALWLGTVRRGLTRALAESTDAGPVG
ncbi:MAG: hypothetical protein K1X57_11625 [Gemmataceae bacterium]|nr:hypothetical protein [Gemmataceae bacterium]